MDKKDEIKDNKNFAQKTFENMKEFTKLKICTSIMLFLPEVPLAFLHHNIPYHI